MNTKEKLQLGEIYIKSILNVDVHIIRPDEALYGDTITTMQFCMQQLFPSATHLKDFICHLQEKSIYEVTDRLHINWMFICTDGCITILGPFRTSDLDRFHLQKHLKLCDIPKTQWPSFQRYYNSLALITPNIISEAAFSVIKSIYNDTSDCSITHIDWGNEKQRVPVVPLENLRPAIVFVEQTHDLESRFMTEIEQGNFIEADLLIQKIILRTKNNDALENIFDYKIGCAIMRTLMRIAAKNAGVPSPALDELTSEYNRKINAATSIDNIETLVLNMIEQCCLLVQKYKLRPYGPIVRRTIHHIMLHLSEPLSVKTIADAVDVSPNYLSATFHNEVDEPLSTYIQKQRIEKSAQLLRYTTSSIQQISASVGIMDNNYFTKLFKKVYNETPSEFRRHL